MDFIWFYFSIIFLLKTLFSPWKKDISFATWRGLHPVLFIKNALNNIISRLLGMIVRSLVIMAGILFEFFLVVGGFLGLVCWIFFPLVFLVAGSLAFFSSSIFSKLFFGLIFIFSIVLVIISVISFFKSKHKKLEEMSLLEMADEPWFIRVWNRMGFLEEQLAIRNVFSDQAKLEVELININLTLESFGKIVNWEFSRERRKMGKVNFWERENLFSKQPIGKHWSYGFTVHLDRYARDIQESIVSTQNESHLVGHEKDVEMVELILTRPSQNSVILVGDPGMGKKTFINFLAKRVKEQKIKNALGMKRFVELDLKALISHQNQDQLENEISRVFYEAAFAGNVILIIHNLHEFLDLEKEKFDINISKILEDFLEIPSFQIIGTISQQSFHGWVEKNAAVMKSVDVINFTELTLEETIVALLWWLEEKEGERVFVTYQAIERVANLSDQFINNVPFPEKAIDSLEEVIIMWMEHGAEPLVTRESVENFFSKKFNVPVGKIGEEEKNILVNLESILHQRVIGQNEAIKEISEVMRRVRSGISDDKKPIGSFLFLGPTGVGKTETAKAFAEAYFGSEERMIRFDMTEFQGTDSVDRFLGSKSRNENSQLIDKVSDNPFSVILFDEIEKAHPDILNLLLQVLDEGWITDVFGKKAVFNNTIIVATSNAGAALIEEGFENDLKPKDMYNGIIDYIIKENIFRPEFLNRFGKVILFRSLHNDELIKATEIILVGIAERIYKNKKITIIYGNGIVEKIIEKGYNHVFGMRSVKHFAQSAVEDLVAKNIISGAWKAGSSVEINVSDLDMEND